nr:immunoglobulin heavy chain junction region [Mus musculus]
CARHAYYGNPFAYW